MKQRHQNSAVDLRVSYVLSTYEYDTYLRGTSNGRFGIDSKPPKELAAPKVDY
jgi:hypothetical protein